MSIACALGGVAQQLASIRQSTTSQEGTAYIGDVSVVYITGLFRTLGRAYGAQAIAIRARARKPSSSLPCSQ